MCDFPVHLEQSCFDILTESKPLCTGQTKQSPEGDRMNHIRVFGLSVILIWGAEECSWSLRPINEIVKER